MPRERNAGLSASRQRRAQALTLLSPPTSNIVAFATFSPKRGSANAASTGSSCCHCCCCCCCCCGCWFIGRLRPRSHNTQARSNEEQKTTARRTTIVGGGSIPPPRDGVAARAARRRRGNYFCVGEVVLGCYGGSGRVVWALAVLFP